MNIQWRCFLGAILSLFFPILALADESGSMSFAPPASDISVTFLGNIFGVVDGVLHGTGSQIMGTMFGVFNAAVLALGGIVMMYIILVSTMNTAHEGQMLGQKWSSIWVPVRATIGLALLIPKTSGYCLMQVFVMWVVLQGVGVADKIWGAALDYLNRGGVIIQANMAPNISMGAGGGDIMKGSARILYGQVCMVGLQSQLERQRESYLDAKEQGGGPCSGTPSTLMQKFCDESVPDFINTVDPIDSYNEQHVVGSTSQEAFHVDMPNFDSDSIYYDLNKVCGEIKWDGMAPSTMNTITDNISTISQSDVETIEKSRAAAIEQVYITLSTTARTMVSNDPQLNSNEASDDDASVVADDQFGVAYTSSQTVCTSMNADCPNWGQDSSSGAPVLLDGTELQDAVADYNAVMAPVLKLIDDASNSNDANDERAFIGEAKERGWIMAGSYFFDLARLNGSAAASTSTDASSGFGNTNFSVSDMQDAFDSSTCSGNYATLCEFLNKDSSKITPVAALIDGTGVVDPVVPEVPNYADSSTPNKTGKAASTVYGYAYNASLIDLAEQEGTEGPTIEITADLDFSSLTWKFPSLSFGCHKATMWTGCLPEKIASTIWNEIYKPLYNSYLTMIYSTIEWAYKIFVIYPLTGFSYIFQEGVSTIGEEGVNPIVALAKMGVTYIDFSMNTWIIAMMAGIAGSFAPPLYALLMVIMPLFLAWEGMMVTIGFTTAYFVPFLPYMIFTFGAIAWMIAVIEAMVAAPIVALGVAHPEGHDALGKSEQGLMILLNVFLRPGMMVVGYIAAIALSYVGIWIMNAGYENVLTYLESDDMWMHTNPDSPVPWARFFGFFFGCLVYTMMYLTIVQKAFMLIAVLPDKVLRWIGGQPEGAGQETMQWSEESKGKVGEAGKATADAGGAMQKQMAGMVGGQASGSTPDTGSGDSSSKGGDDPSGGGAPPAGGAPPGGGATPPPTPPPVIPP